MEPPCKKQKLDENEKDTVVYFDPQRIPVEIWNQILHYISVKDLLNLSLVCKTFLETIDILPEAIDKIELKLNKETLKDEALILQSSRNYTNISLKSIQDIEACKKIIAKFGENVRNLEFFNCSFTIEESNSILEMTQKNLKTLSIIWANFKENSQSTALASRTFKLSKLQKLRIFPFDFMSYNGDVLDFMPDTLLEVSYNAEGDTIKSQFLEFLKRQKNLKNLNVIDLTSSDLLNEMCTNVHFKLEKLEIISLEDFMICQNLEKFLKSQADSLKELKLTNISLNSFKESFKNMPNLQLLHIDTWMKTTEQYESGPSFNCPSLKTIIVDFGKDSDLSYLNFIKGFQNIQKIVLKMNLNSTIIQTIAENHPNLKTLAVIHFEDDPFESVSFIHLTEFEIFHVDYEVNFDTFEINMERSVLAMKNLKILKLGRNVLMTANSVLAILVNYKKLEHLVIKDGSKILQDLLCQNFEFFKNLRSLKIYNLKEPFEKLIECLAQFPLLKFYTSTSEASDD